MLWTSIATGKRPPKHGIHGFVEPTEDGLAVRPVSNLGRKTKAVWNILNQNGRRSVVVGWWPSHPAEPINGVMVTNHFPLEQRDPADKPMLPGTVSPASHAEQLQDLRLHASDVTGNLLRHFVPDWEKVDQTKDRSLHDLASIIAETGSIHAAATELFEHEEWDFGAVYYTGIDHFSHRFMRYHAKKKLPCEGGTDPALRDIVVNAYRYHDAMLGRLVTLAGPDCSVMIVSDHGFHSDEMLPDYIPAEAAGPAVEHRDFGVFCLKGPGVLKGEQIYGASVIDVTPTVLHCFGLPAGRDMDGKVLINAFQSRELAPAIDSWDDVPGEAGRHPPERQYDGAASIAALDQLVALGYVAPPTGDAADVVRSTVAENNYNLARAQMDAGRPDLAAGLLRDLIAEDLEQLRYYQHLFQCLIGESELAACGAMLDDLDAACEDIARRAREALERRRRERPDKDLGKDPAVPDRKEMFERRQLLEKVHGFAFERLLMRCRLALADLKKPGRKEAARALLEQLAAQRAMRLPLGLFLAEGFALVGEHDRALECLRRVKRADRESWRALALEAGIHQDAGRFREAADSAVDSLALMYFQPVLHYRLGVLLAKLGDEPRAEQELRVALAQAPGIALAHRQLARLARKRGDLGAASLHLAHAEALRQRAKEKAAAARAAPAPREPEAAAPIVFERHDTTLPVDRGRLVTIVSGLPRTGTSMMMQMLAAGGIEPFTDGRRAADADNPRGYLEHEQATRLHQDKSWVADARGRAVKIVAQLLPYLPDGEDYRLVFMHRNLDEVVASQHAMLERLGRQGAKLGSGALKRAYTSQLVRAQAWLEGHRAIQVLAISYADALSDPDATAARLHRFLGAPFDEAGAAASVDASLRRQRHGEVAAAAQ